jgi:predicted peroxiredoxin
MVDEDIGKWLMVLQTQNPKYDDMAFNIARTWLGDKGLDIALYLMFDCVQLVRKDNIENTPDIKEAVDYLLSKGVPIYVCGFCTRACEISPDLYYPGVQVANRHIYYALMTERKVAYY